MKKKSTFWNMIFSFVTVSFCASVAVSFIYAQTKSSIQENKKNAELSAIVELFGDDFDNNPLEEKINIEEKNGKSIEIYLLRNNNTIYAMAINSYTTKGFGGDIYMLVGFYLDGTMAGYKVIEHKETPGLGSKMNEDKFRNQFENLFLHDEDIALKQDGGKIDAITSATITSRAVIDAINRAKDTYEKFIKGIKYE